MEKVDVVIVEDDDSVRSAIQLLLTTRDLTSLSFKSAEEASETLTQTIELSANRTPSAECKGKLPRFIIDYGLPGKNGIELAQKLLSMGVPMQSITIVSGQSKTWISRQHAVASGIRIVQKPFSLFEILDDSDLESNVNVQS